MKFNIGDPVWVKADRPDLGMVGILAAVVTGYESVDARLYQIWIVGYTPPHPSQSFACNEPYMSPRRDDEGRQVAGWDTRIWKPAGISA